MSFGKIQNWESYEEKIQLILQEMLTLKEMVLVSFFIFQLKPYLTGQWSFVRGLVRSFFESVGSD